jgi:hypothetical protein
MRVFLGHSNCSRLLVWWHLACCCSSRLFSCILHFFFVRHLASSYILLGLGVEKHNSIIITTSDNLIIFCHVQTPHFSFKVRLDNYLCLFWLSINRSFNLDNRTVSKANK